jgi:arginine N-succinyltransferase beta subunit
MRKTCTPVNRDSRTLRRPSLDEDPPRAVTIGDSAMAQDDHVDRKKTLRDIPYRFAIMQPVDRDHNELEKLADIMGQENTGNIRPKVIQDAEASLQTFEGKLPPRQGIFWFKTTLVKAGGEHAISGSAQLKPMSGACWRLQRLSRRAHNGRLVATDYLRFEMEGTNTLEFAGSVVSKSCQGVGLGTLQAHGRILFVLLYQPEPFTRFAANFLPQGCGDQHPFFKHIVSHLLGLEDEETGHEPHRSKYAKADVMRYEQLGFVQDLLGEVGRPGEAGYRPALQLPLQILPEAIKKSLGTIRPETKPAFDLLKRFGFRASGRFDLLDLGPYCETSLEELKRFCHLHHLVQHLVPKAASNLPPDLPFITFAPRHRPWDQFICARSRARVDTERGILWIPDELFSHYLHLNGEEVTILLDPLQPRDEGR